MDINVNWDLVLSCLVIIHLVSEYVHYTLEFVWGKKDKNILEDIHSHRKLSNKTKILKSMKKDMESMKKDMKALRITMEDKKDE